MFVLFRFHRSRDRREGEGNQASDVDRDRGLRQSRHGAVHGASAGTHQLHAGAEFVPHVAADELGADGTGERGDVRPRRRRAEPRAVLAALANRVRILVALRRFQRH